MVDIKLSRPQLKKIYAMGRQMKWSDEMLHLFVMSQSGKEHISQLTRREAKIVIDDMMQCLGKDSGYSATRQVDEMLKREGMILGCTPAQCDKIKYLLEEAGWTEGRLKEYLEQFGAKQTADLTRTLASNLIEYLKSEILRSGRMVANGA